jgi:hypothetical protein
LDTVKVSMEETGGSRVFRLFGDNGVVFERIYAPKSRSLWNRFDPTYDALDEELEDFFLRTVRVAQGALDASPK